MEHRQVRLRPDADVRPDPEDPEHFLLRHPVTNRHARITFEQAAILFYLDGTRDLANLATAASEHSGTEITPPDVESFVAELDQAGLIDRAREETTTPPPGLDLSASAWRSLESHHARRVEALRSEVLAERERAAAEMREAERQRNVLEDALSSAESRLEELQECGREERRVLESRIDELLRRAESTEQELATRTEALREAETCVEAQLAASRDELERVVRESEQLRCERDALAAALAEAESKVVGGDERRLLESRIDELLRRAESMEQELGARNEALGVAEARMQAHIAASREELERVGRESEQLRRERDALAAEVAEVEAKAVGREERTALEKRIEELTRLAESMTTELAARAEALSETETRLESHVAASRGEAVAVAKEREGLISALTETESQLAQARQEILEISAAADLRVRELEHRVAELEGAVSQLAQEIAAKDGQSARDGLQPEPPVEDADVPPAATSRPPLTERDLAPLTQLEEQARRFQQLLSDAVNRLQRDTDIRLQLESDRPESKEPPNEEGQSPVPPGPEEDRRS